MPYLKENEECKAFCPKCKKTKNVLCDTWESSDGGHEDYRYRCKTCGHSWWIDGIDS